MVGGAHPTVFNRKPKTENQKLATGNFFLKKGLRWDFDLVSLIG